MGQPTKESPDVILDMHLKTVGILVNVAAACDLILFNAFRVVSGCESKIANAIYFSFESLQTKKNIVTRVLRANGDSNETKIVEAIISATEKANNKRNEISHALLQAEGNQILALNARQQGKPAKPVTPQYLDDLHRQASKAHVSALREYQLLCQKRGISPSISHE